MVLLIYNGYTSGVRSNQWVTIYHTLHTHIHIHTHTHIYIYIYLEWDLRVSSEAKHRDQWSPKLYFRVCKSSTTFLCMFFIFNWVTILSFTRIPHKFKYQKRRFVMFTLDVTTLIIQIIKTKWRITGFYLFKLAMLFYTIVILFTRVTVVRQYLIIKKHKIEIVIFISIKEMENIFRVWIHLQEHEWKFGRTRNWSAYMGALSRYVDNFELGKTYAFSDINF